jgi:hypothetical protein
MSQIVLTPRKAFAMILSPRDLPCRLLPAHVRDPLPSFPSDGMRGSRGSTVSAIWGRVEFEGREILQPWYYLTPVPCHFITPLSGRGASTGPYVFRTFLSSQSVCRLQSRLQSARRVQGIDEACRNRGRCNYEVQRVAFKRHPRVHPLILTWGRGG